MSDPSTEPALPAYVNTITWFPTVNVPVDVVVAKSLDAAEGTVVDANAIPEGHMALDIGPKTLAAFQKLIDRAKSVFWNGPMGLFEKPAFAKGTLI